MERWKRSADWQRDGGRFIPYPATFLSQRRWEDELPFSQRNEGDVEKQKKVQSDLSRFHNVGIKATDIRKRNPALV